MALPVPSDAPVAEAVRFPSGPNRLEGELLYPESMLPSGAVVVANPHSLLGGDLANNVVRGLTDGLAARGLAALRFNYRGVGRSEGRPPDVADHLARFWETSHVPDELGLALDLEAALDFLRGTLPAGLPVAAVGYSFGCTLLPQLRGVEELAALVLVAPTVGKHDYEPFRTVTRPMLVIAPEDDFATDAAELRRWFDGLAAPRRLVTTRLDDHFFRGYEQWLAETVFEFLGPQFEETVNVGR
jgi:alpha/beta superfamily hydrolase